MKLRGGQLISLGVFFLSLSVLIMTVDLQETFIDPVYVLGVVVISGIAVIITTYQRAGDIEELGDIGEEFS